MVLPGPPTYTPLCDLHVSGVMCVLTITFLISATPWYRYSPYLICLLPMLPYDLGIYVTGHPKLESMCFVCYLRAPLSETCFPTAFSLLVKWAYIVNRNKMFNVQNKFIPKLNLSYTVYC